VGRIEIITLKRSIRPPDPGRRDTGKVILLTNGIIVMAGSIALEDGQYVERLLEFVTPIQRDVLRLVMEGLSTREIAGELHKSDENIRQHLKNGRDRIKLHPDLARLTSRQPRKREA
jgi:DNA-binding NarL/FixJ family response regulator